LFAWSALVRFPIEETNSDADDQLEQEQFLQEQTEKTEVTLDSLFSLLSPVELGRNVQRISFMRSALAIFVVGWLGLWLISSATAADPEKPAPTVAPKKLPVPGETFLVKDSQAFVMLPDESLRRKPQPWIWYAPTLPGYPDEHEKWMHEHFVAAGIAVAGVDVGESYGSPKGNSRFSDFYREMTERRGFATRPCLLGRSRGGLMVTSWAVEHPDAVAGIAGIYPVIDFRTYPGLQKAAPAYELSAKELDDRAAEFNPIERVASLAKARVPAFFIHGDIDTVVPLKENSAEFLRRYELEEAAAQVTLVVAKDQGHNFWEGFFRCQELVDFAIARARAGAEARR
jgi:pimeloyl-ACP methyl ester carboxylesterase